MSMHPGEPVRVRRDWWAGGLAAGSVIGWFALLTVLKPECVADECRHQAVILSLAAGEPVPPDYMPMLPAFHLVAAGLVRLCGPSLWVVRGLSAGLTLLCVVVALALGRLRSGGGADAAPLLLLWNPLFFPFAALAYTEAATVLALLLALYCHLRGHKLLSAAALLVACLIRQSSIVWVAFFMVWSLMEARQAGGATERSSGPWHALAPGRRLVRELWPHGMLLAGAAVFLIFHPSFAAGQAYANRAAVNVAQFYLFGLTVAVLWLPIWLGQLRRLWTTRFQPALAQAWVCAAAVLAVGLLEMAFDNPHPWNADPHYLRNRVLILLYTSTAARLAAGAGLVLVSLLVVALVRTAGTESDRYGRTAGETTAATGGRPARRAAATVRTQRERSAVVLAWVFSLLFIAPHWLVDPRYYIVPAIFVNLLAAYDAAQMRRLVVWYALLSVAVGAMILVRGGPAGGML